MNFSRDIVDPVNQKDITVKMLEKLKSKFRKLNPAGYCDGFNWQTCWCHEINQDCPYQIVGVNCSA